VSCRSEALPLLLMGFSECGGYFKHISSNPCHWLGWVGLRRRFSCNSQNVQLNRFNRGQRHTNSVEYGQDMQFFCILRAERLVFYNLMIN